MSLGKIVVYCAHIRIFFMTRILLNIACTVLSGSTMVYLNRILLKKLFWLCFACLILVLYSCTKKEKIEPEVIKVNYISSASVKDASVSFDTLQGFIQVELPANYLRDSIDLILSLPPGVGTNPSLINADSSKVILSYNFEGKQPKGVPLYRSGETKIHFKYFKVFVKHLGPLKASIQERYIYFNPLAQDSGPIDDGYIKFRLESGLGSIPDSPADTNRLIPILREVAKNITINGIYDDFYGIAGFEGISPFWGSKSVKVGFSYGQKTFLYPDPIQVLRAPPSAKIDLDYKSFKFLKYRETVSVDGGFFLPESKYHLEFSRPGLTRPISVGATRVNHHNLKIEISESIPEGTYKVSSFEEGKAMSHSIYHVSNDASARSIHYIWKEDWRCPSQNFIDLPSEEVKVTRGECVNVNPFPIIVQSRNTPFDPKKFTVKLALRSRDKEFVIQPEARADECYGDESLYMYYGRYIIPREITPGLYEAFLIDASGKPSLASWQKILII
jgi:hypothetical protein